MTRRRKVVVGLLVAVMAAVGAFAWALPEIARRIALAKIPEATGRAVQIEDIDFNLLTGRFAVKKLRLADREGPDPFVELERLDGRVSYLSLFGSQIRLIDLTLTRPIVRVIRTGPREFNFSDLIPVPDPRKPPSRWVVSVNRFGLSGGAVLVQDRALSPPREWRIDGLSIGGSVLTTRTDGPGGRLTLETRVNGAKLDLAAESLGLGPGSPTLRVSLQGLDLTWLVPYLPPDLPARPEAGRLSAVLTLGVERGVEGLKRAKLSGDVKLEELSMVQSPLDGGAASPAAFLNVGRVSVGIKEADLLARTVTLASVEVDGPDLRVTRSRSGEIDLLAAFRERRAQAPAAAGAASAPATPPAVAARGVQGQELTSSERVAPSAPGAAAFELRLERLTVRSGSVAVADEAVSPRRDWRISGLTVDGAGLSTSADDPPGTLQVKAGLAVEPSTGKPATLAVDADSVRLTPLAASARVTLEGFALGLLAPYWPPALPAVPRDGSVGLSVTVAVERGEAGLTRAVASGSARLDGLALIQPGQPAPFLRVPKLAVGLKQADAIARTVTVGNVEIEGLDLRAVRDAQGKIDLLALAQAGPPAAPAPVARAPVSPPGAKPSPAQPWKLALERFSVGKGTATIEDRAVSPTTTLAVTDLAVRAESFAWPAVKPGKLSVTAGLPGGGLLMVQGTATLAPLDVTVAISILDAPIAPYHAYFPFRARFDGLFSGDSLSTVKLEDGKIIAASQGNTWVKGFQAMAPGATNPAVQMERMEIRGIDFAWPTYAFVDKVTIKRPEIRIEREADGTIDLRRMFEVDAGSPAPSVAPAASGAAPVAGARADSSEKRPGLLETMVLDFREITIEDGYLRFLDRTLQPVFSQDMSRLALVIRGLSNAPGRRATLSVQAIVGGDAALDLRGEVSRIGEDLFADLVGELRDFSLTSVSPYTNNFLSWLVNRGKLAAKLHYRIERGQLSGTNEINIANIQVAPAGAGDEVKRRIGLPLGLIVGLLKDSRGNITFDVPLTGNWKDRSFDWGEAVWSAVKQVLLKVLAAPFRAIGRLFTGGGGGEEKVEELTVNPVTFSAGSSVLGPEAEGHLKRVADFLREKPALKLSLAPVATAKDAESIKAQELTARVQRLQRESGMPDFAAAVHAYFVQQAPTVTPPKTADEQLALLREREPLPPERVKDLLARRLEATREALTRIESIPAERLLPAEPRPLLDAPGDGRVDFTITAE